jgi:hypothetical protein
MFSYISSCVLFNTLISFLIAESIPFFGNLVGLIGALLATLLSMYVFAAVSPCSRWH